MVQHTLEGRDGPSRGPLTDLRGGADENLMKFNKVKCKALHQSHGNPKHTNRLHGEMIKSGPVEKDFVMMVDAKVSRCWQ